ncbi:carboxymuconolactone decarboxylase family protein [Ottowia thiooxydans]|uniref:carboxymuconolactone decarboxylase family protein n=1 Tax=Ottowia thiooxydans TaxID=219182 RepID=UPI000424B66A|nr:carboxymuconolactone decarboxylase family protein [Ottowia thiooxydans]
MSMKTELSARIEPLDVHDPRSKDPLLEELVSFVGYRPNALLTMARKPGVVPGLMKLLGVTLRGDGLLTESLRFLVAAEAARGAECRYTTTHLIHVAHHLGVSWEKLAALPSYLDDPQYTDKERKALAIASAGGALPVREPALAMEQAKSVFSDEEIIEIVSCVAMTGWFNRWNGLMGSALESVPSEALSHVQWLSELNA